MSRCLQDQDNPKACVDIKALQQENEERTAYIYIPRDLNWCRISYLRVQKAGVDNVQRNE